MLVACCCFYGDTHTHTHRERERERWPGTDQEMRIPGFPLLMGSFLPHPVPRKNEPFI